jgi:hypothetical protein
VGEGEKIMANEFAIGAHTRVDRADQSGRVSSGASRKRGSGKTTQAPAIDQTEARRAVAQSGRVPQPQKGLDYYTAGIGLPPRLVRAAGDILDAVALGSPEALAANRDKLVGLAGGLFS